MMDKFLERVNKVLTEDHRVVLHPSALIFVIHQLTLRRIESSLNDDRDRTYRVGTSLRMAPVDVPESTDEADLEVAIKEVTTVARLLG